MTQNSHNSEDRRVQRTQKDIMGALLDLTAQKGFAAVTVSGITKQAGLNRATVYRHYRDKFDLLDKYLQTIYELLEMPSEDPRRKSGQSNGQQLPGGLVKVYEHIRANAKFYRVMLGKNGDPAFVDGIRQHIQKRIRSSLPASAPEDKTFMDLYLSYCSNAIVGGVLWWLDHGMAYSSEEMAAFSRKFDTALLNVLPGRATH